MTIVMDNFNSKYQDENPLSDIQLFYNDMTIFLTGGTGFIGHLILEKLIRSCSGLKRIYMLIREKKGKSTEERFKDLFNNPVFEVMRKEQPNYLEKITVIIGDCALPNLGIEERYEEILKNEVNIVIHSAATVRFDEHLRIAANINIRALQDILKLSKGIRNLKSVVHISTAYSYCNGSNKIVDEIFYDPPMSGDKLLKIINSLDDEHINQLTPTLLKEWPNTYTMTKAIAEGDIKIHGEGLPIGIVRPSMIISTDTEPISGWINNFYGPTGVSAACGVGLLRCVRAAPCKIADMVPGDYVCNAVLASAWDIHNQWKENNKSSDIKSNDIKNNSFTPPIYNFVSFNINPLTWAKYMALCLKFYFFIPSIKAIGPIMIIITSNSFVYFILYFLLHTLPAYIIDSLAKLSGRTSPMLMDRYRKIHKFVNIMSYFSVQTWKFHDNNTRSLLKKMSKLDQSLFNFDLAKLNWGKYTERHVKGIRLYIMCDSMDTVRQGFKRMIKLYIAYITLIIGLAALFLLIIYKMFVLII